MATRNCELEGDAEHFEFVYTDLGTFRELWDMGGRWDFGYATGGRSRRRNVTGVGRSCVGKRIEPSQNVLRLVGTFLATGVGRRYSSFVYVIVDFDG